MIKIYKTGAGIVLQKGNQFIESSLTDWDVLVNHENVYEELEKELSSKPTVPLPGNP